jgi:hypothetical protein
MRTLSLVFACCAFGLVPAANAQPADLPPPTIALSFWRCDRSAMDQIIQGEQERGLPVYQSFVDSGRIFEAGVLRHAWGDEYNYVSYLVAPDFASIDAVNSEINDAYEARYPDDTFFLSHCSEHFDNIYTGRVGSGFTGAVSPDDPATVVLSFWKCPLTEIGRLIELESGRPAEVAAQMTEEGLWRGSGFMVHSWGDAWNVVRYTGADDMEALMTAFDTLGERLGDPAGVQSGVNQTCTAHRDNIYDLVVRTTPRAE